MKELLREWLCTDGRARGGNDAITKRERERKKDRQKGDGFHVWLWAANKRRCSSKDL